MKTLQEKPKQTIQLDSIPIFSFGDWNGVICVLDEQGNVYSQKESSQTLKKTLLHSETSKITSFLVIEKNHYVLGYENGKIIDLKNNLATEISKEAKPIVSLLLVQNHLWTCTSSLIKIYSREPLDCVKIIQCYNMDRSYLVGTNIWTLCDDGIITIRDSNGVTLKEFKGEPKPLSLTVIDGGKVIVGFHNSTIKFYDVSSFNCAKFRKVLVQPESIAIGMDSIWCCSYKGISVYDLNTFQLRMELAGKNFGFCWILTNQDDVWAICTDKKIRIWGKEDKDNNPSPIQKPIVSSRSAQENIPEKEYCEASTQTESDPYQEIESLRVTLENTTKFHHVLANQVPQIDLIKLRDQISDAQLERTQAMVNLEHKDFLIQHILPKNNETMKSIILSLANELYLCKMKK